MPSSSSLRPQQGRQGDAAASLTATTTATSSSAAIPAARHDKGDEQQHSSAVETTMSPSELISALQLLDPLLQFLTRQTGQTRVPLSTLYKLLCSVQKKQKDHLLRPLQELIQRGILHGEPVSLSDSSIVGPSSASYSDDTTSDDILLISWQDPVLIGFPPPSGANPKELSSSTKSGAKRRWKALQASLDRQPVLSPAAAAAAAGKTGQAGDNAKAVLVTPSNPQEKGSSACCCNDQPQNLPDKTTTATVSTQASNSTRATLAGVLKASNDDDSRNSNPSASVTSVAPTRTTRQEEQQALEALRKLLGGLDDKSPSSTSTPAAVTDILSSDDNLMNRAAHAGSQPAQESVWTPLASASSNIPSAVLDLFGLDTSSCQKPRSLRKGDNNEDASTIPTATSSSQKERGILLYRHQALAIQAALDGQHVTVCTGTGSGKSLCFWIPVLTAAFTSNRTSLILFPTKALAQDQYSKLQKSLLKQSSASGDGEDICQRVRLATLDGDTPHSMRADIAASANIILTNPDTLHAALLPSWRKVYASFLSRLQYVVLDEAHVYQGVFGAHVAMVLSRLVRVASVAASDSNTEEADSSKHRDQQEERVSFLAASATLPWPETQFRQLCPIPTTASVKVLASADDGSPRAAKHFFLWNPPLQKSNKNQASSVAPARGKKRRRNSGYRDDDTRRGENEDSGLRHLEPVPDGSLLTNNGGIGTYRRHAADETALLLAHAVVKGVRCIAFCKTRSLVEWVYERALGALNKNPATALLTSKLESYRGGYNKTERREIERRLFQNELIGVVGTNALELGVDIGGVDLTLHCGYPSSYSSLMQQAGRAGRGGARSTVDSCSVVVCFNSPAEQHMWRHPETLLSCGLLPPKTMQLTAGLVQGHLLCASEEFPLAGEYPVSVVHETRFAIMNDRDLFGGKEVYAESLDELRLSGSVLQESAISVTSPHKTIALFKPRPSLSKAWSRVSLRSIEPVNYAVVDISHPGQGGKMDKIHDPSAVMDTLPYSRVFYHAHPGAIITHRGRKYKVLSMTRPPPFAPENFSYRRTLNLAAFAKPTSEKYMTRPLSNHHITVVRQMERVECIQPATGNGSLETSSLVTTLAGCGAVSVTRTVHGYKRLSLITRVELSRAELLLPPIEFDTFGIWIDAEADELSSSLGESYGAGVHALQHALLAVAPLFVSGLVSSDLDCDHSYFNPTQVMLFDERAGGSGSCQRLWEHLFRPNGILEAALKLIKECSSCCQDSAYDGGCPACLHLSKCLKFNAHISRSAALVIGERMLKRIQETDLYKQNSDTTALESSAKDTTPRRKGRSKALRAAKEMHCARERQFVVGRPSWPLDGDESQNKQVRG